MHVLSSKTSAVFYPCANCITGFYITTSVVFPKKLCLHSNRALHLNSIPSANHVDTSVRSLGAQGAFYQLRTSIIITLFEKTFCEEFFPLPDQKQHSTNFHIVQILKHLWIKLTQLQLRL